MKLIVATCLTVLVLALAFAVWVALLPRPKPFQIDFSKSESMLVVSSNYYLPEPINVSTNYQQWATIFVTNTSGKVVTVTPPKGWSVLGIWSVTNVSAIVFQTQPRIGYGVPVF